MADLQEKIETYQFWVDDLGGDDLFSDVFGTLYQRDDLAILWEALTPAQRIEVEQIDEVLISKHELLAEVLPMGTADNPERRAKGYWWWFLDEGPQVREQIGRARENG
jgi:hypothetical protein